MKLDVVLPYSGTLKSIPAAARMAEELGFDAIWTAETQHDPFLPGPFIAEHSEKLHFGTAIAVSFARSPATLAYTAWDLAALSGGRFILGLGTQIKPHIERRFGLPWPDSPVGKLREQIQAIRAFWNTWQTGEKLNFRGDYYTLTLMSPFFNPGPIDHPAIPIYLAGVNTGLAGLAGEEADGFHAHPLHTTRYLREVIQPAIAAGAQKSGRSPGAVALSITVFIVTNETERAFAREQVAFYASTPTYRSVLEFHGWEETARQLSHLAARGRWEEMPALITDEMLAEFAVEAAPGELANRLHNRYAGLADRITLYKPFEPGEQDAFWESLRAGFGGAAHA
jgi:probable F420-dependent oxidoreductase